MLKKILSLFGKNFTVEKELMLLQAEYHLAGKIEDSEDRYKKFLELQKNLKRIDIDGESQARSALGMVTAGGGLVVTGLGVGLNIFFGPFFTLAAFIAGMGWVATGMNKHLNTQEREMDVMLERHCLELDITRSKQLLLSEVPGSVDEQKFLKYIGGDRHVRDAFDFAAQKKLEAAKTQVALPPPAPRKPDDFSI